MLDNIQLEKILFIDIETVPVKQSFSELSADFQVLWDKKSKNFRKETETAEEVYQRAGIYAEFGKIICISFGIIFTKENGRHIRVKSFANDDEKLLLSEFIQLLQKMGSDLYLCGHNVKEFDIPYISRRILINGLKLPQILNVSAKKPWETTFIDTLELWKFGDYKNYTSLNLLTHLFDIPSPKSDIDGSMVATVYYDEKNLKRISHYCQNDVVAVIQLILRFKGENLIGEKNIEHIE